MTPQRGDYERHWRSARIRLWAMVVTVASSMLFLFAGAMLEMIWKVDVGSWILDVWGAAFAITGFSFALLRCPRCGQRFFMGPKYSAPSAHCLHCGLPWGASAVPRPPRRVDERELREESD